MPVKPPSRAVKRCGTEQEDPKGRTLRAGALSAQFDNGQLRYIRVGDVEVLRAIAFLVRDENWGTFAPVLRNLKVKQGKGGFTVTYDARCADAKRAIAYKATIRATPDGTLAFHAKATPETGVLTNRTGFVVLHPLKGVARCPVEVLHVDGRTEKSVFPAIIDPIQPFKDIRALTHRVLPGLEATCRMDGDTFEMEDHRNWTDASFKTYVRPLALPWPYTLPKGKAFEQSVTLSFTGKLPRPKAGGAAKPLAVTVGKAARAVMPMIGVGVPGDEAAHALDAAPLVKAAGPQLLICEVDTRKGGIQPLIDRFRRLGTATGAGVVLEVIVPGKQDPGLEIAPVATAVAAAGLHPAALFVTPSAHLKAVLPGSQGPKAPAYADLYKAARRAFPRTPLGGGMYSYFTELNRNPPPAHLLDYVSHTTAPIVHAADDVSVMETLEALPFVVESARAIAHGRPYRVGPSAIAARDNPYGAASAPNPNNGRVCLSRMDPRQRGLFGAAWTLGYAAVFAKGGLEAVSLNAATGPAGLVYRKTDFTQPWFDAVGEGVYPAYHVVAGLAAGAGAKQVAAESADPAQVAALAWRTRAGTTLWLANLTAEPRAVKVAGLKGAATVHVIDEGSFSRAAKDPAFLAGKGGKLGRGGTLKLGAYAVARLASA